MRPRRFVFSVAASGSVAALVLAACVSVAGDPVGADGGATTPDATVAEAADSAELRDGGEGGGGRDAAADARSDAKDAAARRDALAYPDADSGVGLQLACSRAVKGALHVAVDRTGAMIVVGDPASADFGSGPLVAAGNGDLAIAKYDASCNLLWVRTFGDTRPQSSWEVAVDDSDDILVYGLDRGAMDFGSGRVQSLGYGNAVLAKLSPSGVVRWSKSWGAAYVFSGALAVGPGGEIAISGVFGGDLAIGALTIHGGPEGPSLFVAKLDSFGEPIWARAMAPILGPPIAAIDRVVRPTGLAIDANGDVVVALTDPRSDPAPSPIDLGGGPIAFPGAPAGYLAKLDVDGQHVWSLGRHGRILSVAVDPAGFVVTADALPVPSNAYAEGYAITRRSPLGVVDWSRTLVPGPQDRVLGSVVVDSVGRPLLLGQLQGSFGLDGTTWTSDVDPSLPGYFFDGLALQLERGGAVAWSDMPTLGAPRDQAFWESARGIGDDVAALLGVYGTVVLGGTTYTSSGSQQLQVLVHYRPGP